MMKKRRENSEIHNRIQTNMSDKLIRTMRRMTRHTNRITITAEPFDGNFSIARKNRSRSKCLEQFFVTRTI